MLAHFDLARELLSEYLDEHIFKNVYPKGIGSKIFDIIGIETEYRP